ncbi:hypothetical protein LJC11_00935 [Bacteroidales bacterium OttesenSCG-928-I21]|nr:hypothetical protein [Bacteroidales bacterium OttesenSCG-928-I21]
MKKSDLIVILCVIVFLSPFFFVDAVYDWYQNFNATHPMIMSFIKFAILSTFGECIGLRITSGVYNKKGFGVLPRAIVWGVLGMGISMAMTIFSAGIPAFLIKMGMTDAAVVMGLAFSWKKLFVALCISVAMNTIFAPVFMTLHKVTDTHIMNNGGTLQGLFRPIQMGNILSNLDWKRQWGFVFKKTIPFFWYPAHTITFLLPVNFQVLFAAILGVALGVLLSIAALGNSKK